MKKIALFRTMNFKLHSQFSPAGDQPEAIRELVEGLQRGDAAHNVITHYCVRFHYSVRIPIFHVHLCFLRSLRLKKCCFASILRNRFSSKHKKQKFYQFIY
jgi:hypothetical protein